MKTVSTQGSNSSPHGHHVHRLQTYALVPRCPPLSFGILLNCPPPPSLGRLVFIVFLTSLCMAPHVVVPCLFVLSPIFQQFSSTEPPPPNELYAPSCFTGPSFPEFCACPPLFTSFPFPSDLRYYVCYSLTFPVDHRARAFFFYPTCAGSFF